jgi:hypothetical protein
LPASPSLQPPTFDEDAPWVSVNAPRAYSDLREARLADAPNAVVLAARHQRAQEAAKNEPVVHGLRYYERRYLDGRVERTGYVVELLLAAPDADSELGLRFQVLPKRGVFPAGLFRWPSPAQAAPRAREPLNH